ncbi:acyltransferase [Puniceicoccaceae bacterium K14]|nr:acyltransferase [Puniceicoccaceae bacterium K14]
MGSILRSRFRIWYLNVGGAQIERSSRLGKVTVSRPAYVRIGTNCEIEDYVRLRPGGGLGKSSITIGDDSFIGHSTQINVGSHCRIGRFVMIAPGCIISDAHHPYSDKSAPMCSFSASYKPIIIEDDVWIGSGCTILQGVTIKKGAIVAAGSVLNKSIQSNEIWGGVPARFIKYR